MVQNFTKNGMLNVTLALNDKESDAFLTWWPTKVEIVRMFLNPP